MAAVVEAVDRRLAIKEAAPLWKPEVPVWHPEISLVESQGGWARRLWEERLAEFAEAASRNSRILFTGIGGGAASVEGMPTVRKFQDGSEVPRYVDLKKEFGEVPELLFLVASPKTTDNVLGLRGLAREYKEQGVRVVVGVMTGLGHEREDHRFRDKWNGPIPQVTMLKDVIELLAGWGYIDGGVIVGPHSLRSVELASRKGFPLLPIDPFNFLIECSGFDEISPERLLVMGPDKGRRREGVRMADWLQAPLASAVKERARLEDGYPTLFIPPRVLEYIRDNNCTVAVYDDEIREGGTVFELAEELTGCAQGLRVCAFKAILAGKAVYRLNHPLIKEVIITDAVQPLTDVEPIRHKLRIIPLQDEIVSLVRYLQRNLVRPGDPDWLRDSSETGTLLELDLRVERYE